MLLKEVPPEEFEVEVENGNDSTLNEFLTPFSLPSTSARPDVLEYVSTTALPSAAKAWVDPAIACNETDALLRQPWFWTSISLQLFLAPAAIIFNLILLVLLCRKSLLAYNVRLILANFSIWAIIGSLYLLGKGLWTLYAALCSPCALEAAIFPCKLQEIPLVIALVMVLLSLWALALERMVAGCRMGPSEASTKEGTCCGQCLTGWLWAESVAALVGLLMVIGNSERILPYCNSLFTFDAMGMRIITATALGLEILGLLIYFCVVKGTRAKNERRHERDSYSLTWQVYRKRLVDTTELLGPVLLLHGLIWVPALIASLVQTELLHESGLAIGALVSEYWLHLLAALHFALHPLLLLWSSEALRREARDCCSLCRFCVPISVGAPTSSQSLDLLTSVWAKPEASAVHGGGDGVGVGAEMGGLGGSARLDGTELPPEEEDERMQLDPIVAYVDGEQDQPGHAYDEMLRSDAATEMLRVTKTTTTTKYGGPGEAYTETVRTETRDDGDGGGPVTTTETSYEGGGYPHQHPQTSASRLSSLEMRSRFLDTPGEPPLAKEDSALLATIPESSTTTTTRSFHARSHHHYQPQNAYDAPPFERDY